MSPGIGTAFFAPFLLNEPSLDKVPVPGREQRQTIHNRTSFADQSPEPQDGGVQPSRTREQRWCLALEIVCTVTVGVALLGSGLAKSTLPTTLVNVE